MKKWVLPVVLFIIILILAALVVYIPSKTANAPTGGGTGITNPLADLITVSKPLPNDAISSPLAVSGQARGNWYFEASFPVQILDQHGNVIAQAPAQAQGEWMTTDFVPFAASIPFPAQPAGSVGQVVFKNDNPSGDPSKDKELIVPITFK